MDEDIEPTCGEHAVEVALPIQHEAGDAEFGREGLDLRTIARAGRQGDQGIAGEQATQPAAEHARPAKDEHAKPFRGVGERDL